MAFRFFVGLSQKRKTCSFHRHDFSNDSRGSQMSKRNSLDPSQKKGMFSLRKGTFCDKKLDERKKERSVDKTRQK